MTHIIIVLALDTLTLNPSSRLEGRRGVFVNALTLHPQQWYSATTTNHQTIMSNKQTYHAATFMALVF